ncbi:MAG TPA: hypothetical protein VI821_00050 [Candidatus Paceibacterota bacterium]
MFNIENGVKIFENDGNYAAVRSPYPEYRYKGVKYGGKSNYGIVLFSDPSNHDFNDFIEIEYSNFCTLYNRKISQHYSICNIKANGIYTEVFKQSIMKRVFITGAPPRKSLSSKDNDAFTWIFGTDFPLEYYSELHKDALMFAVYIDTDEFIRKAITDIYNFPNILDTKFSRYCIGDIGTIHPIFGLNYTIYKNPKNISTKKRRYDYFPTNFSIASDKVAAYIEYSEIPKLTEGKIKPEKLDYCHICGHKLYGNVYLSYSLSSIYCDICVHRFTYLKSLEKMYIAKHPVKIEDVIHNYYDKELADVLVQCIDMHPIIVKGLIYKCHKDNTIICFSPFYLLKDTFEQLDNYLNLVDKNDCKLVIITYQPTVDDIDIMPSLAEK